MTFAILAMVACGGSGSNGSSGGVSPEAGVLEPDAATTTDGATPDGSIVIDCPTPTGGPTIHTGEVTGEETWTAAASPHIIDYNVNVRDGGKLTIEPCATVQVAKDMSLRVAYPLTPNTGTLIAEGSPTHPIRFSGKDGARWGNIYVNAPGTARLRYVTLEGGGDSNGWDEGTTLHVLGDGDLPADPILLADHLTIKNSTGTGLWMNRGATFMPGSSDLVVTGCGSDVAPFPVKIEEHSMDAFPTGTFTGNKLDEIRLTTYGDGFAGDGLTVDATLHDRGVPYRVEGSFYIGRYNQGLATMTIEPGVTMKFEKDKALNIQKYTGDMPSGASLVAVGTAAKPIVFTSASPTPVAGDWVGLWYGGALHPSNKLDHVRIEYAGGDCLCSLATCNDLKTHSGAVVLTNLPSKAFITNSAFVASAAHGVTEGFTGDPLNFRATNTFTNVAGCDQTLPLFIAPLTCPNPRPACNGI